MQAHGPVIQGHGSACILEHSETICMHSGTFCNILHSFWNILEHSACILEHSGTFFSTCPQTDRQTLGLVELRFAAKNKISWRQEIRTPTIKGKIKCFLQEFQKYWVKKKIFGRRNVQLFWTRVTNKMSKYLVRPARPKLSFSCFGFNCFNSQDPILFYYR